MKKRTCNEKTLCSTKEWERVLWKKQPFPDNYVSESFFRVHTKCIKINLSQAFYGSLLVSQEICSCVLLVVIFWSLSGQQLNTFYVLLFTGILSTVGYCLVRIPKLLFPVSQDINRIAPLLDELKTALFTVVLSWFSSPFIKTLTASVATDTIHACTIALLLLHLILHPYGADVAIVNPTMSHNLGLFAAVCLASRLSTNIDVFALVIVAIGLFTLLPSFRFYCQEDCGKKVSLLLSFFMMCSCFYGLILYASFLSPFFIMVILFINIVSPILFIYLQPNRRNIYGPWDEALIKEQSAESKK